MHKREKKLENVGANRKPARPKDKIGFNRESRLIS